MHLVVPILCLIFLLVVAAVAAFWLLFPLGVLISGLVKFGWQAIKGERPWWVKGDMKRIGSKDPTKNWGPF